MNKKLLLLSLNLFLLQLILSSQQVEFSLTQGSEYMENLTSLSYLADPLPELSYNAHHYTGFSQYMFWDADRVWIETDSDQLLQNNSPAANEKSAIARVLARLEEIHETEIGVILILKNTVDYQATEDKLFYITLSRFMRQLNAEYLELGNVAGVKKELDRLKLGLAPYLDQNNIWGTIQNAEDWSGNQYIRTLHLYDYSGKHSTLESAESVLYRLSEEKNADLSDTILEIPTYGRKYKDNDKDYWFGVKSYQSIIETYSPDTDESEAGGYYFNSIDQLTLKVQLANQYGIKAVRIAKIENDGTGEYSLWAQLLNIRK